jgi:hypothetical protein
VLCVVEDSSFVAGRRVLVGWLTRRGVIGRLHGFCMYTVRLSFRWDRRSSTFRDSGRYSRVILRFEITVFSLLRVLVQFILQVDCVQWCLQAFDSAKTYVAQAKSS